MAKRGRTKYPTRTLPLEIIQNEILVKLPSKPLLKCRAVSKLWCAIIDDPKFALSHYKKCQNNKEKSRLLVIEPPDIGYTEQVCTIRNSKNFRKMRGLDIELKPWRMHYQVVGYVNGVLCLQKYRSEVQPYKIVLWNPSIKKALEIPYFSNLVLEEGLRFEIDCVLAYDFVRNDYKVVTSLSLVQRRVVQIFTLSDFSWKDVRFSDGEPSCLWVKDGPKVYLDGVTYWTACENKVGSKGRFTHFMSFDAVNDAFKFFLLPDCEKASVWCHERFPILLDQSIGLMEIFETYSQIWIIENNNNTGNKGMPQITWAKKYVLNHLQLLFNCIYVKMDGEILFTEETGGVKSYNLKTQEIKVLAKSYKIGPLFTDDYKESLALLGGKYRARLIAFPPPDIEIK